MAGDRNRREAEGNESAETKEYVFGAPNEIEIADAVPSAIPDEIADDVVPCAASFKGFKNSNGFRREGPCKKEGLQCWDLAEEMTETHGTWHYHQLMPKVLHPKNVRQRRAAPGRKAMQAPHWRKEGVECHERWPGDPWAGGAGHEDLYHGRASGQRS